MEGLNVHQRKQAVMKSLGDGIPKNGWNSHHKYHYAADADVLDTMRKLFVEHGLDVTISAVDHNKSGSNTLIMFEIELTNVDNPEDCIVVNWPGEANDSQDKGTSKAATAALKYWLLKTFVVSTGDIGEDADAGAGGNQRRSQNELATVAQKRQIEALAEALEIEDIDATLREKGLPKLALLTGAQASKVISGMKKAKGE